MIGPNELRSDMVTFSALMQMFESSFLSLAEVPENCNAIPDAKAEKDLKIREKACSACYHLQEMADRIADEMLELADHMEVCDAIFAANYIRHHGGEQK